MPTKPLTQPELWAPDAVYSTGPFIGQPQKVVPPGAFAAEGHRPGALFPTPAEYENSQQYNLTGLARWVFLGSNAPDPDAHIIESDATGYPDLFGLHVTNNVNGPNVVDVTSVNTLIPAVYVECLAGASAVQSTVGTASAACFDAVVGAGTGFGLTATMTGTLVGGAGVYVLADGASSAHGIIVTQNGSGRGVLVTGGTGEAAIEANSAGNQPAIYGIGSGTGPGVIGQSSATGGSVGVYGVSGSATSFGVYGITTGGATTASSAVRAAGLGDGYGVNASSINGAAITGAGLNAYAVALYLPGKASDPTNVFDGRMDYNTTTRTWVVSDVTDVAYRDVWTSRGGIVLGAATLGTLATTVGAVNWQNAQTLTLSGSNAPKRSGRTITLRFGFTPRAIGGIPDTISVRLRDTTAGADVFLRSGVGLGATAGIYLAGAVTAWQAPAFFEVAYTVPATGSRTFTLDFRSTGGSEFAVRDASIVVHGAF